MTGYMRGFAMHQQIAWVEQAKNPTVALWLRVAFLAFGTHRRNGHASFYNWKEIAEQTKPYDKAEANDRQVRRAIAEAIARGFLSTQSNHRCLVVLPHWVSGGSFGRDDAGCNRH